MPDQLYFMLGLRGTWRESVAGRELIAVKDDPEKRALEVPWRALLAILFGLHMALLGTTRRAFHRPH
jgi:hypothetical protein